MTRSLAWRLALVAWLLCCGWLMMSQSDALTPSQTAVLFPSCNFKRIDFTTGSLGRASLSRASSATYINSGGTLTTASSNAARFNYDANYPAGNALPSLTGPFLLYEGAATNLLQQSNGFSSSPWYDGSPAYTIVSGAFTSPDGTSDGWTFATGAGSFPARDQNQNVTAGNYVFSLWDKTDIGGSFAIGGNLNGTNVSTNPTVSSATISRFSMQFVGVSAGTPVQITTQPVDAGAGITGGVFGMQVESGNVATSYIATTTVQVSRSADVGTFTQSPGCRYSVYTFDDNSKQVVTQAPGLATIPTTLNRPNIKYIDGTG